MSPRAGGETDKFGNRYEGVWTVQHLLHVLAGKAQSIKVEDFGDLAQGVEFTYCRDDAIEVHQVKRQNGTANSWTVKSLQDKKIWENVRHHVEAGREFHFISTLPAPPLQELADRARRAESATAFENDWLTNENLRDAFSDLCSAGIYGSANTVWNMLKGFWIDWPSERNLVETNATIAEMQLEGATGALAAAGLGDLVVNALGRPLDAPEIEVRLRKYGLRRSRTGRKETHVEQVRLITENWASGVERELLQPTIARSETDELIDGLNGTNNLLLLTGTAGGGKTAVLHESVQKLQANDTAVLCFRIDRLDPFATTKELGQRIGLDVSPITALANTASRQASVLVVDQLDAVSLASGRMPRSFDAIANLVREASAYSNMRILLACRKFDVDNDYRIRELVDEKQCKRVEVAELSDDQLDQAVDAMGLEASELSSHQRKLLRSPLNLVLLRGVAQDLEALSFQTANHLFDAFWRRKLTNCTERRESVRFDEVISTLANAVSKRQRLSVPVTVFDRGNLSVDADILISEHVLVRDDQQIAFFHEGLFDYAFARGWIESDQTLVEFLTGGDQELFRRAQVRQIMTLLRDLEPRRFVVEVQAMLLSPQIRYHIKDVAIALLGVLSKPTTEEWGLVTTVLAEHPSFEDRLWNALRTADWFDRLDAEGLTEDWLAGADADAQSRAINIMVSAAKHNPGRLAQILQKFAQKPDYLNWLRWAVRYADLHQSRPLFELLLNAVRSGQYARATNELWLSVYGLGEHQPEWAVELLAAHLVNRPGALELDSNGKVSALLDSDHGAVELAQRGAAGAPESFCELILPYLLRVMALTSYESKHERPLLDHHFHFRYPKEAPRELGDALLTGASRAIRLMVTRDPQAARSILETLAADPHESAQWLLYEGLRSAGGTFAEWTARLLLEGTRRYMSGYASNSVWNARRVVQATSSYMTEGSFQQLETAILALRFPWEKQRPGWYMFNLLSAMDEGRLSELGRRRLGELRRMTGFEQPPEPEGVTGGFVGPPIPTSAAKKMNDAQWLRAISKHNTNKMNWRTVTGGADEQSQVLKAEAVKDPLRFVRIALQFTEDTNPAYCDAILMALADAEALADPAPAFDAVRHIASLGHSENERWLGWALKKYLKVAPLDLFEMIVDRTANASDPIAGHSDNTESDRNGRGGIDLYTSGINSTRGAAAESLADLLLYDADGTRTALVLPVLERMAKDPSLAVRSCMARVVHAVMRRARPEALSAFNHLIDADDALLATPAVVRLMAYLGYENSELVKPVVERMVKSPNSETREIGGQLAALAAMQWGTPDQFEFVLSSDNLALLKGAAAACAQGLPNTSNMAIAERGIKQFTNDNHEEVRKASAEVVSSLRGQRLGPYKDVLLGLISSATFSDALPQLLITLDQAPDRVDDLVLACAKRFIEVSGADSDDIRNRAAGDASHVGDLLVRAYAQATSRTSRLMALDMLDQLLEVGAYGVMAVIDQAER